MYFRERRIVCLTLSWILLLTLFFVCAVTPGAEAALFESRFSDGQPIDSRADEIELIRQTLEKEVVSQRLSDYGLDAEEVSMKLSTLSDEQIHQLAGLSSDIAPGSILEGIIAILLIVLLVVLILKVADKEIIIK